MSKQAKGPTRLWLLVPRDKTEQVVALGSENVAVDLAHNQRLVPIAHSLNLTLLTVDEHYGSYRGPIGRRVKNEAEIRASVRRKNPGWTVSKLNRAMQDLMNKQRSDFEKHAYECLWLFLCKVISLCGQGILVYDDGRDKVLEEIVPTSSMLRDRVHSAQRISTKTSNAAVLYSVNAHEFYVFE